MERRMIQRATALFVLGLVMACSSGSPSTTDAGVRPVGDATRSECSSPADCNDGIDCTSDLCAAGTCSHMAVPSLCPAGASCDVRLGCQRGAACASDRDCVDSNPCTANERCDPSARTCRFDPLDGDGDGHAPRVCGGDDCDDASSGVNPMSSEQCNGRDDNCNGQVDEAPVRDCESGFVCVSGGCACPTGRAQCAANAPGGSQCFDLQTARDNCGACGRSCGSMGACVGGRCSCASGTTLCGDLRCINTQTDRYNCGACGTSCANGATCMAGTCRCPDGQAVCGTYCVNIRTDVSNCGSCGNRCMATSDVDAGMMTEACVAGTCGCASGTACPTSSGSGYTCLDTSSDPENCGTCGHHCVTGATCTAGACACPMGQTVCGSGCVDTRWNSANCGACGMACPTGQYCNFGSCATCVATGNSAGEAMLHGVSSCCSNHVSSSNICTIPIGQRGCTQRSDCDASYFPTTRSPECSAGLCCLARLSRCSGLGDRNCCPGTSCVLISGGDPTCL